MLRLIRSSALFVPVSPGRALAAFIGLGLLGCLSFPDATADGSLQESDALQGDALPLDAALRDGAAGDVGRPNDLAPSGGAPSDAVSPSDAGSPVDSRVRGDLRLADALSSDDGALVRLPDGSDARPPPADGPPIAPPDAVVAPSGVWRQLSAGEDHTCGITTDGRLYCWGFGNDGQVGTRRADFMHEGVAATGVPRLVPVPDGQVGPWLFVSAGVDHTCALLDDGRPEDTAGDTLWCWGKNDVGQVGAVLATVETPRVVGQGLDQEGWTFVSAGWTHTCGVRSGRLYCWGENSQGELGHESGFDGCGSGESTDLPVAIDAGGDDWRRVVTGYHETCATRADGSLSCWGANNFGGFGDGTEDPAACRTQPGPIAPPADCPTGWDQVSMWWQHVCATACGGLYCWGRNIYLNADPAGGGGDVIRPVRVFDDGSEWVGVSTGIVHTCAVASNGSVRCFGYRDEGALGSGFTNDADPGPVPDVGPGWRQVAVGGQHSCGVRNDGTAACWGDAGFGQLGDGVIASHLLPVPVTNPGGEGPWTRVATAMRHTCGLQDGHLYCWGNNTYGQIPWNRENLVPVPSEFEPALEGAWRDVSAAFDYTCAIDARRDAWCWPVGNLDPVFVPGPWLEIAVGITRTCGLKLSAPDDTEGDVFCWPNFLEIAQEPVCADCGTRFVAIRGFRRHCALDSSRHLWCWGVEGYACLQPEPIQVPGVVWQDVTVGDDANVCGIVDGGLYCGVWGSGEPGAPCVPENPGEAGDRIGGLRDWTAVQTSGWHQCAIRDDVARERTGVLYCWGDNVFGQIGIGSAAIRVDEPREIGPGWASVRANSVPSFPYAQTCGIRAADDSLWCWGRNNVGQLGTGESGQGLPTNVLDPPAVPN